MCATCSVAVEAAAPAADAGEAADVCTTCGAGLRAPTAFDCARLGLLPELEAIVEAVRRRARAAGLDARAAR